MSDIVQILLPFNDGVQSTSFKIIYLINMLVLYVTFYYYYYYYDCS